MFQMNISEDLDKECPPKKYTNTTLDNILNISVIQSNLIIRMHQYSIGEKVEMNGF